MNHDEHLDNFLDEALSEYRDAEPLAGLESRVLRRLQASKPARAGFWLRCGIAAAARGCDRAGGLDRDGAPDTANNCSDRRSRKHNLRSSLRAKHSPLRKARYASGNMQVQRDRHSFP